MKKVYFLITVIILIVLVVLPPIPQSFANGTDNNYGANDVEVMLNLDNYLEKEGGNEWKLHMKVDICRPQGSSIVSVNSLKLKSAPVGSIGWERTVEASKINKNVDSGTCINYSITIEVPKSWGCIKVEATASTSAGEGSGNDGSDTWVGSTKGGTGNYYSPPPDSISFSPALGKAKASGLYSSNRQSITFRACKSDMFLEVNGDDAELKHEKEASEKLNSKWAFWTDPQYSPNSINELPDSSPDSVNSDTWVNAKNLSKTIKIPKGWSGKIKYRMIVERNGLNDLAGEYSGTVDLEIRE